MSFEQLIFVGIDLGTSGVRAIAVRGDGAVVASASVPLDPAGLTAQADRHEQPPDAWWNALCQATRSMVADLEAAGISRNLLEAVAVDGTSGSLVSLDRHGNSLRPAIMYNDPRAAAEAEELNDLAGDFCSKLGYQFNASFALPKILWLNRHEPVVFSQTDRLVHQADFGAGRLTGAYWTTDYSNALKTGYDLIDECWPVWMDRLGGHGARGIRERLPPVVVPPGTRVGLLTKAAALQTGLPEGLQVVAGATDGTAAFLASGAKRPGDYNTTLGTTLVFKGISRDLCRHPDGLIYCHKLPGGLWLPGAASNTGTEWIQRRYPGGYPHDLDAEAAQQLPCEVLAYPLARQGERFPFLSSIAVGFITPPECCDAAGYHAAQLQGTAFIERLAYEVIDEVALTQGGDIFSTGGGGRNDLWLQCRADVTGRVIHRPVCAESAFGAAVLAGAGTIEGGWQRAVEGMVKLESTFQPHRERRAEYDRLYRRFCEELRRRGYL